MPQFGVVDLPDVEVLHIDIPVGGSLPLAPQQQTLLSRGLCKTGEGDEEMMEERGWKMLEKETATGLINKGWSLIGGRERES